MQYLFPDTKKTCRVLLTGVAALAMTAGIATAEAPPPPPPPLSQITVPDINKLGMLDCSGPGMGSNCGGYAGFPITKTGQQDKLIALGKALFWDMQVGSDGVQACASCHFHAGADHRIINQKNPGLNRVKGTQAQIKKAINPNQLNKLPDTTFTGGGPNSHLTVNDFPLPFDTSAAAGPNFGQNDVISSQGVRDGVFGTLSGQRVENGSYPTPDPNGFNLNNYQTVRRVPPRNTPSAHAAIYNLRNFWDGRANLFFNGVNPFGMLDPAARVSVAVPQTQSDGTIKYAQSLIQLMIPFSSAASQAVGPPGSDFEMSLAGRTFNHIAAKLLAPSFKPLDRQKIAANDSVLGIYRDNVTERGLGIPNTAVYNATYVQFIKDIFQDKFWKASADPFDTSLMQKNFALFFGLAVQAYEATLIPNDTPVDKILARLHRVTQPDPLSSDQIERGLAIFTSATTGCSGCHVGSETTSASVGHLIGFGNPAAPVVAGVAVPAVALVERMVMGNGSRAVYDSGFYNIGVRPTADDLSIFNRFGNVPFSFGMLGHEILANNSAVTAVNQLLMSGTLLLPKTPTDLAGVPFAITTGCAPGGRGTAVGLVGGQGCKVLDVNEYIAIRGSFKTPGLRNVNFTGPYFHNGAMKNLSEVVNFYNTGGRFNMAFNPDKCSSSTSSCVTGQVDFDREIKTLGLTPNQIADLVAFLEIGLTDQRVAKESAPFDHPQLCLPHGHNGQNNGNTIGDTTDLRNLPEVGSNGHAGDILTFEQMLNGASGAHDLSADCDMWPAPNINTVPQP